VDTYLQVVPSQTALLQNERNDIDITRRRLEASAFLSRRLAEVGTLRSFQRNCELVQAFVPWVVW